MTVERIVDVHTHLYAEPDYSVESNLADFDVAEIAADYVNRLETSPVDHAIAIVMDESLVLDEDALSELVAARDASGLFSLVFLVDPFAADAEARIERAAEAGAVGIKLHPYQQNMGDADDFPRVAKVLRTAERHDLVTIIDAAYGETQMYNYNGVRLGHSMAKVVDSPILLAHGGAVKVLDAFSTAVTFDNVYLDTSFSIPYWEGSSVVQDYVFAMEKMSMDKWMWGTDIPYMGLEESLEAAQSLLVENELTDHADALFHENATALFDL